MPNPGSSGGSVVKNLPANPGDSGSIPGECDGKQRNWAKTLLRAQSQFELYVQVSGIYPHGNRRAAS